MTAAPRARNAAAVARPIPREVPVRRIVGMAVSLGGRTVAINPLKWIRAPAPCCFPEDVARFGRMRIDRGWPRHSVG
jgi:hypothetical protein